MRKSSSKITSAAMTALFAITFVGASFADNNESMSPSDTRRRNIAAVTHGADVCRKNTEQFTDYQYSWYIMNALREVGLIMVSGGTLQGTDGTPTEQVTRMLGELIALNQCQFDMHARRSGRFALVGCLSVKSQMWALDEEARYLRKKSYISRQDHVDAIEKLLPGVQACRDKLGKCYNPNNKQQAEWATTLFAFETYVREISENKSRVELHLPACSKTMLADNDDKPKPGDQRSITYLDTAFGLEDFWTGTPGAAGK